MAKNTKIRLNSGMDEIIVRMYPFSLGILKSARFSPLNESEALCRRTMDVHICTHKNMLYLQNLFSFGLFMRVVRDASNFKQMFVL